MCGNFAEVDPTQQSWTAQAEPSSLLASLKIGRVNKWLTSKHDVKGAFLNAVLPEGRLVVVSPPKQWIDWGLVAQGTLWTLEKAVYGLRESPALWSAERDGQLRKLEWSANNKTYQLRCCPSDSQVWLLTQKGDASNKLLGTLIVYVDDFLLQTEAGPMRDAFLAALGKVWTLDKEKTLSVETPFTFLGIEIIMRKNGDILLHQRQFIDGLLEKYGLTRLKGNSTVQIDKLPEEQIPTAAELKKLQTHSGEFNWLATRTRLDLSYYTSLLASASSKHAKWSQELANKILRFLASTRDQGIVITCTGDLTDLMAWSDAGFAGSDTRSQSGLIISLGGSIIVWRSSRQTVSTISTAEAELNAATLAWQVVEGVRLLLIDFGIQISSVRLLLDNKAALTIAQCGASWRTRYFAVRGHRLHEEHAAGRASLEHCKTDVMLADALTKLASTSVIATLHAAMHGEGILAPSAVVSSAHVDDSSSVPPLVSPSGNVSVCIGKGLHDSIPVPPLVPTDGDVVARVDSRLQRSVRKKLNTSLAIHRWGLISSMLVWMPMLTYLPSLADSALAHSSGVCHAKMHSGSMVMFRTNMDRYAYSEARGLEGQTRRRQ